MFVGLHFRISATNESISTLRDSHTEVFFKKNVLKNFAKLTANTSCRSRFFWPETLLKRGSNTGIFR